VNLAPNSTMIAGPEIPPTDVALGQQLEGDCEDENIRNTAKLAIVTLSGLVP
jgi:hypothetical protein